MKNRDKRLAALEMLDEAERAARHGWVLDDQVPAGFQQSAEPVLRQGLAELADRDTRAELSARVSRPVRWAARLTSYGRDVLVFARALPLPAPDLDEPRKASGAWTCGRLNGGPAPFRRRSP